MKKLLYGLFLTLLAIPPRICVGQKDTSSAAKTYIDFDPSTMTTLNLPADSPFDMKIHLKAQVAKASVRLVRNRGDRKLSEILDNQNFRLLRAYWDSTAPTLNIRFNYRYNKDSTDQLNADLRQINRKLKQDSGRQAYLENRFPYQKPAGVLKTGNGYTLLIFSQIDPKIFSPGDNTTFFDQCYAYYKSVDSGATAKRDSAELRKKAIQTYDQIKRNFSIQINDTKFKLFGGTTANTALLFFKSGGIYKFYKQNDDTVKSISSDMDDHSGNSSILKNYSSFHSTLATARQWLEIAGPCKANGCCSFPCADSNCLAKILLANMWEMQPADWKNVNEGIYTLDKALSGSPTTGKPDDPSKRSARIDSSAQLLQALRLALAGLEMIHPTTTGIDDIKQLDQTIADELFVLAVEKANLTHLTAWNKKFASLVADQCNDRFKSLDLYGAGSYIMDFSTRTSVYITPVFGYAVYGFQNNFTDFSPYLGFQINFKPIASKIPFQLIRPMTLLQRLCFTTAWTLRSVSYPAQRQDFFGNSTSLITALGFKFGHVIMINVGTLWFKQLNPNPVLTNKKIVSTPLVGLSANFSISQLINGFTTLIPSL
jgi:hypothetical protein